MSHCCISFLRPLRAPRPVVLRQFMRLSSSANQQTDPTSLTPFDTPKSVAPTESYFVRRTSPGNLPVYQTKKRGGNLRETRIKKIEGNIMILRDQLQDALGVESKEVNINPLTHDIIIKGWKKLQVTKFLEERRF